MRPDLRSPRHSQEGRPSLLGRGGLPGDFVLLQPNRGASDHVVHDRRPHLVREGKLALKLPACLSFVSCDQSGINSHRKEARIAREVKW